MNPADKSFLRAMVAAWAGLGFEFNPNPSAPPPAVRKCIQCGKEKRHNNSFCSAECAKEYKRNH